MLTLEHGFNEITTVDKFVLWAKVSVYGRIGIFLTLFLGLWGVVVSYNVLRQQKTQLVGFDEFLIELRDALVRLEVKANAVKVGSRQRFELYLYDYHPLIGIFSSPVRYNEYREVLDRVIKCPHIDIIFLTNHEDSLSSFFKRLGLDDDDLIVKNSYEAITYIKDFEKARQVGGDYGELSLWRSDLISEYHFVIVDDIAFQYVVLPDVFKSGRRVNSIRGTKSEDPFVVNYLKKTFSAKLDAVISHTGISYRDTRDGGRYEFRFEPQSSVDNVSVQLEDKTKLVERDGVKLIVDSTGNVEGFSVRRSLLKTPFEYSLNKYSGGKELTSEYVHYRELMSVRHQDYVVSYIKPELVDPKDHLLFCCGRLQEELETGGVVNVTVFYDSEHCHLDVVRQEIDAIMKCVSVPYIIAPQGPNCRVAIEVTRMNTTNCEVKYSEHGSFRSATVISADGSDFFFSTDEISSDGLESSIQSIYDQLDKIFHELNIDLSNVYRMWNYIGRVSDEIQIDDRIVDNYNIFCGLREKLFNHYKLNQDEYPAATGVGVDIPNFYGLCAFASTRQTLGAAKNLQFEGKSPRQKLPYKYTNKVLRGDNKPLFQRGKFIQYEGGSRSLFISGIASIKDEDTYNEGDDPTLGQLQRTISCLFELLKVNHNEPISLRNMSYVRIYYAPGQVDQFDKIQNYLNTLLHDVPHIYLKSEICRQDLHVELEAAMY